MRRFGLRSGPEARLAAAAVLCLTIAAHAAAAAEPRVGDAGASPDPAKFDERYPDMKEWAEAGVRGGIPPRGQEKVARTVKPGDDLQAAINDIAKKGGGVVLLSSGVYPIAARLDLMSGVVLRGEDEDKVVLECGIRSNKLTDTFYTVRLGGTKKSGLEDLTIRHAQVTKLGQRVYAEPVAGAKNDVSGITDLHVGGVQMERAEDCWLDNVNLLHTGSHPLDVQGDHITVRDMLIDGAFNKGGEGSPAGSGNVYFAADHGLFYNNTVRNTRHALVLRDTLAGGTCRFNVILDCNFEGDVNFHGNRKDEGHHLFEGTLVRSPPAHGWPAWSYWKRTEIGEATLVYRSLGWGGQADAFTSTDPAKVYTYTGIRDPNVLGVLNKPAPKSGTLYAVKADRPTTIDKLGAWPKTPGEAEKLLREREIKGVTVSSAKDVH
jgi:hypothetical protein